MFQPRRPMPPFSPMRPPMNYPQMNQTMFQNPFGFPPAQMNVQKRGIGGLLQRLLNKGQGSQVGTQGFFNPYGFQSGFQNSTPSMFQGARSASTLQNLTNPANLSSILGNVQKTLKTAETIVPMVQQYGPLVKNIPALWKIYRELKTSDGGDTDTQSEDTEVLETDDKAKGKSKQNKPEPNDKKRSNGKSVPRLYI